MVIGSAQHSLDEKGRIVMPATFRDFLHGVMYLALGDENEVVIWPETAFEAKRQTKHARELDGRLGARDYTKFMAFASVLKIDGQFRVAIPEVLRGKAGLRKDVTLVGRHDHIAIWDTDRFESYMDEVMA